MTDDITEMFAAVGKSARCEGARYLMSAGLSKRQFEGLDAIGYFSAPASKGHHLAYGGGLFEHSTNVTRRLISLTGPLNVEWPRTESPYLIGMLHDLVKAQCYRAKDGGGFEYVETKYPGHGSASVNFIEKDVGIELHEVERTCIRWHMGAFNLTQGVLESYDRALDRFPREIIATHTADILAARVDEVFDVGAENGSEL